MKPSPTVLLAQLPIPPAGLQPIVGNVPLAAGYLILHAQLHGLDKSYDLQILPPTVANTYSDCGLVEEILARDPWMVGFSCYLWNINRTLWIAQQLKQRRPELLIILGGPEITSDNAWVLESGTIDFACIGEGEQTFTELLQSLATTKFASSLPTGTIIPGLWQASHPQIPLFRKPLANLSLVSSPYLTGILNAADERMLLLETIRGCVFKCKFCYYPKSYDALYFVDQEKVVANLQHARKAGATEIVLLDPTLNQRRDFNDFLKLLANENPDHQFTYFGELRAEGIQPETAKLLREANFTEVEIGLQSIDPQTQSLMDRRNNLKAFERGVAAMLDAGIKVKVDLIIGLPGDTVSSVRRGYDYLRQSRLFTSMQVFNLAILPGTAFRHEANDLGLKFQPQPPYYVYETPTLSTSDLYQLMEDAQEAFDSEWDPFPEPKLQFSPLATIEATQPLDPANPTSLAAPLKPAALLKPAAPLKPTAPIECVKFDLDAWTANQTNGAANPLKSIEQKLPPAAHSAQALCVWFSAQNLTGHRSIIEQACRKLLSDNPHSTLQVVLEPTGDHRQLQPALVERILAVCYEHPNYLDRFYSLNPQGMLGSKRVVVKLNETADDTWAEEILDSATLIESVEPTAT